MNSRPDDEAERRWRVTDPAGYTIALKKRNRFAARLLAMAPDRVEVAWKLANAIMTATRNFREERP